MPTANFFENHCNTNSISVISLNVFLKHYLSYSIVKILRFISKKGEILLSFCFLNTNHKILNEIICMYMLVSQMYTDHVLNAVKVLGSECVIQSNISK